MRGIRQTKPATYVVRACVNGVQHHVGTYRTHEAAVRARDEQMLSARTAPCTGPIAKKAKSTGVYERFTGEGVVYDAVKYQDGHYCWGGRFPTREAAEAARARMTLTPKQSEANREANYAAKEHGITIRFNKGRRSSDAGAAPQAVYIARSHKKGGRHLGTFKSLELARAAVAQAAEAAAAGEP